MTTYNRLYQFNHEGLSIFKEVFRGRLADTAIDPLDPALATAVEGTKSITATHCATAKELAQLVLDSLGNVKLHNHMSNNGLWSWLTFILRDVVLTREFDNKFKVGQECRWDPAKLSDLRDANRHLVRMPVFLLERFGKCADHLLCGPPNEVPKIRYELSRTQGMLNTVFQSVARMLYYDDETGNLKPGSGGIGSPGTAYRLSRVYQQLDVTWEIENLEPEKFMKILPAEFDRFKPGGDGDEDSMFRKIVNRFKS